MASQHRYLLFAGDHYYPSGGWDDFVGTFGSVNEALDHFKNNFRQGEWVLGIKKWLWDEHCWCHVVKANTWVVEATQADLITPEPTF